jgi:hypothetical protein
LVLIEHLIDFADILENLDGLLRREGEFVGVGVVGRHGKHAHNLCIFGDELVLGWFVVEGGDDLFG